MSQLHSLHLAHAGFESARKLTQCPPDHPLARLHGHSFAVQAACPSDVSLDDLETTLGRCAEQLSYRDLNVILDQPADDRALLKWFSQNMDALNPVFIELKTAPRSWSKLNCAGQPSLTVTQGHAFEAAHQLPNVPAGHKCGRMHGHGFFVRIESSVESTEDPVAVREQIDAAWAPLGQQLQWSCLNDIPGLENPTSELLAVWLWEHLNGVTGLASVAVNETPSAGCWFDGQQMRIWKEQTLDCAIRLTEVASDDPRRKIHGHTLTVRLHLTGELDQVLGWVHDFGDVKTAFKPIFDQLDHHPLYTIDGLEHADPVTLARWIHAQTDSALPGLCQVDVERTPHTGAWLMDIDRIRKRQ